MALIGTIAISMKVQTEQLVKGMKDANGAIKDLGKNIEKTKKWIDTLAGAVAGFVVVKGIVSATQAAMDFSDVVGKVKDDFGVYADAIIKDADRWNAAWGTDRSEFLKGASDINVALKGVGYAAKDAAAMSGQYARLATDMHARYGITVTEAAAKVKAAIASGGDALAEYGVDLSETAVKLKAEAMGMKGLNDKFTTAQSVTARVAIIQEKLRDTYGATAKSTDDASAATEALSGRFKALMETIGTAFLPLVTRAMTELQVGVQALAMWWGESSEYIINEQGKLVKSTDATKDSFSALGETVKVVADVLQFLGDTFHVVQSAVTMAISGWVRLFGLIGDGIGLVTEKLTGIKRPTNVLLVWADQMDKTIEKQHEQMWKDFAAPFASESIAEAFKKARQKIDEQRKLAEAGAVDPTKFKPVDTGPAPTVTPKFASAATFGSQEAANAIIRSRTGGDLGGKDANKKTAENTAVVAREAPQQTAILNRLLTAISPRNPSPFGDPLMRAIIGGF